MRADRLLKLADFLETIPAAAFDIEGWQTRAPTKPEGEKQGDCGFAGCAMGWAAHTKMFPGLSFVEKGAPMYRTWWDLKYQPDDGTAAVFSFDAAALVMDLEHSEATRLFDPDAYEDTPQPGDVAARIRELVSKATS